MADRQPVPIRDSVKNTRITVQGSQQSRRLQALNRQQEKRDNLRQSSRNFAFLRAANTDGGEDDEDDDDDDDDKQIAHGSHRKYFTPTVSIKRKRDAANEMEIDLHDDDADLEMNTTSSKEVSRSLYCDQIMLAEWMDEIPPDLGHKYIVVSCPVGKRCLVIAGRGRTICRNRKGAIFDVFDSMLPHGSRASHKAQSMDLTVLDCIYSYEENVIWVLDLISWRGTPYHDCDTDFRFYWTGQKLDELKQNADMPAFRQVLYIPALSKNVQSLLSDESQPYSIDGLLFYHREAHYTAGVTPLCSWVGKDKWPEFSTAFEQHALIIME